MQARESLLAQHNATFPNPLTQISNLRCDDDERQVKRWAALAGEKGRFRNQLIKKILNSGEPIGSKNVSPVVRQTLWHWGMEIDEDKIKTYKKIKGL